MAEKWLVDARTFGSRPTGVGMYAYRHVLNLMKNRDVILVTDVADGALIGGLSARGLEIHVYGRRVFNSIGVVGYFRFVQRVVVATRPDVFWQPNNLQPFRPKGVRRVIVTMHDVLGLGRLSFRNVAWQLYYRLAFGLTLRNVTEIWYNSRQTKREVEARSTRARQMDGKVVYPIAEVVPATDEAIAACRARHGRYFLYVGNLETRKGADLLLAAFRRYREQGGTASVVLAGQERDVHPVGGDGVEVLGYVEDGLKLALMGGALALVVPSRAEGYGMPVAEAASLGITCVAADLPVFREIAPNGRVTFPVGDAEALARVLLKVVR